MLENNGTCQLLCRTTVSGEDANFINERIRQDYELNFLVDGLPAAELKIDKRTQEEFFDQGFNLGSIDTRLSTSGAPKLHNHYDILFRYHRPTLTTYRIVGVLVWPFR
jgi:transmembrane 9 superfamily member 2/4